MKKLLGILVLGLWLYRSLRQALMSSKKAMKKMQKLAFQKHKNNIRNNKFKPKTNKIFNKHKK